MWHFFSYWSCKSRRLTCNIKEINQWHFCDIPRHGSVWKTTSTELQTFQPHFNLFPNFSRFCHHYFYCNNLVLRNSSSHGDAVTGRHLKGHLEVLVRLTCTFLPCGRKLENLERNRHKGNLQTPLGKVLVLKLNPKPSWDSSANHRVAYYSPKASKYTVLVMCS